MFSFCVYLLVILWDFSTTYSDHVHPYTQLLPDTPPSPTHPTLCPLKIKPSRPICAIVFSEELEKFYPSEKALKYSGVFDGDGEQIHDQLNARQALCIWAAAS